MLFVNEWCIETGKFPNGESWVNVRDQFDVKPHNRIEMIFESNDDLVNLMFLKKHLDDMGVKARLVVRYFPYSRMDRDNGHYAFSLKYIADFINSLDFESVRIAEPHSDVTPALLKKVSCENWIKDHIDNILCIIDFNPENDLICVPDAGAAKRYGKFLEIPYCYGKKERDFKTGNITSLEIVTPKNTANKVLIIDDLCSRGGTFLEISKKIKENFGPDTEIYLAVAHCETNVFNGELLKEGSPVKKIFTSSSIKRENHPDIIVF